MKKKTWGCLIPLILVIVLIAAAVWLRIPTSFRALRLLDSALEKKQLGGALTVLTDDLTGNAHFYWSEVSDERYVCLNVDGMELYYHDEAVWFDNGRGYDLQPLLEGLDAWDEKMLVLAGFRSETRDGQTVYTLQLDEARLALLERLTPVARWLAGSTLSMVEENGTLSELTITTQGICIQAELDHTSQETIPTEVLMQMTAHSLRDVRTLAPLLNACAELAGQEVFGADVKLNVECGPLPISDSAQVYGAKDSLYFFRGGKTSELSLSGMEDTSALFWGLGWTLSRDAELMADEDGSQIYTLTVDAEVLNDLFSTVLPELNGLDISLEDGTMTVTLRSERITALTMACSGEMPFLITTIPMEFSVELVRMEGAVTLPEEIR